MLTKGNLRTEKGKCDIYKRDVYEHAQDLKFIAIPPDTLNASFEFDTNFKIQLGEYREALGKELYLATNRLYQGRDQKRLYLLSELGNHYNIPIVATNDVHCHDPSRRQL